MKNISDQTLNFTKEFKLKASSLAYRASPRDATTLMKFIESCKDLKLGKKFKNLLQIYSQSFGAIPPQFKDVNFVSPYVNKEFFERLVNKIESLEITIGKCYYIVSVKWLNCLNSDPEASDITHLEETEEGLYLDPHPDYWEENFQLKKGLIEGTDFFFLEEALMEHFQENYGGIYLKRYSLLPNENADPVVEVCLLKINIQVYGNEKSIGFFYISRIRNLDELFSKIERMINFRYNMSFKPFKLWKSNEENEISEIVDLNFGEDDHILIEFEGKDKKFKLARTNSTNSNSIIQNPFKTKANTIENEIVNENKNKNKGKQISEEEEDDGDMLSILLECVPDSILQLKKLDLKAGRTGLQNLGNTCFMNSALQCLSNTFEFTNYFLKNLERDHINRHNPLGTKGILAANYSELMKSMWLGKSQSISPWEVKKVIGRHAHQFVGYGQQDSQEFLSYILDLLHEDLNRIVSKPYIESKDYDGKNDIRDSDESWNNFLKRNDSVVISLFYGQYKSTVCCSKCSKVSVTYDPFNVLSIPISHSGSKDIPFTIYVVQEDIFAPVKKIIKNVNPNENSRNILEKVSASMNIKHPLFIELSAFKVTNFVSQNHTIEKILNGGKNVIIYEMSPPKEVLVKIGFTQDSAKFYRQDYKMIPKIIWADVTTNVSEIYDYIAKVLELIFKKQGKEELKDFFKINVLIDENFVNLLNKKEKQICFVCDRDQCKGCELPNTDTPLSKLLSNQTTNKIKEINLNVSISIGIKLSDFDLIRVEEENSANKSNSGNNIFSCLSLFTEPEILDENNSWFCSNCKCLRESSKTLEIMKVPEILIIHLKRFKITKKSFGHSLFGGGTSTTKITKEIDFPLKNLDLSDYVKSTSGKEPIYELFAVSNHYGGMGGGHYTAYAKNRIDEKWYDFNDSRVSEIKESAIVSSAAYLLFYKRKPNK